MTGNSTFVPIFKEREKLHSGNHKLLSFIPTPHKILDGRIKEEIGNSLRGKQEASEAGLGPLTQSHSRDGCSDIMSSWER